MIKPHASSPLARAGVDGLWSDAAARIGLRVTRTADAFATVDEHGVIAIGMDDMLDDDDAAAQLVFHELCHAITEGERGAGRVDWGLDNTAAHVVREHACLRVQAALADRFGLRALMAPTTEYRGYHDDLGADPLHPDDPDPAAAVARAAVARFDESSWRGPIERALALTQAAVASAAARHPLGFALGPAGETCGGCAWLYVGGRGAPVERCRQRAPANGDGARTARDTPACARWEPPVDCRTCGACCREAYHSVTVSVRDPVVWQEPHLIVRTGHRFEIRREGPRCAALANDVRPDGGCGFSCAIYQHRPRPCREFAAGGRHCLEARRRVGLGAGADAA